MRQYLASSYSSFNRNKLHGLLAEIDLRKHLAHLGYGERVSPGGWIVRNTDNNFGETTLAAFPETLFPTKAYDARHRPQSPHGLHTVSAMLHQIGIEAYFCSPRIGVRNRPTTIEWRAKRLGVPENTRFVPFPPRILGDRFTPRRQGYNFLRYNSDVSSIPSNAVPEEFAKESLRVAIQSAFMTEISDIDGIFWGNQFVYPLEIKEKTAGHDRRVGDFFGLDIGPFTKLAFYAAKGGNLKSLFIVREIDDPTTRQVVHWWFITFEELVSFASWTGISGGTSMTGSRSAVIRVPKDRFHELTAEALATL